jgi:hypothetical protein
MVEADTADLAVARARRAVERFAKGAGAGWEVEEPATYAH